MVQLQGGSMRALFVLFFSLPLIAGDWQFDEDNIFAVVTHKAGIAKGLAHNHLIHSNKHVVGFDGSNPSDLSLVLEVMVDGLVVDDPDKTSKYSERLIELEILTEAYGTVSEKDRLKIRKAMLGKKQLNAKEYPEIKAKLLEVKEEQGKLGALETTHRLKVSFEIMGQKKDVTFKGKMSMDPQRFKVEAFGSVALSDFGIKPYSALFGAISNEDIVHFMLVFGAKRT